MLTFDESRRNGMTKMCDCCHRPSERTWTMVDRDGEPYALFFAACYDHGHERESWIDVTFGSWGQDTGHDDPLFGHKLTRAEALAHPRIKEFWAVVDLIVLTDPLVHAHHYGHPPR